MIDVHIDALTNSVLDRRTAQAHATEIDKTQPNEVQNLPGWNFNWAAEARKYAVWKLTLKEEPSIIQGLVSLEIQRGFVFVSLIENAPSNLGSNGRFAGVAGNLFAFACKLSFEQGFDGYVSFVAKTELIGHYQKVLGANLLHGRNMVIEEAAATKLVQQYFTSNSKG